MSDTADTDPAPATPRRRSLLRQRDFVLLWAAAVVSSAGSQLTTVAYPLLVLGLTGSPAEAGLVGFARLVPVALFSLPAGVVADRVDRRRLMIAADAVRAVALASLGAAIWAGHASVLQAAAVGFVEGAGWTFFNAARVGALRAVVPTDELPAAVGLQQAGSAAVRLVGPAAGGALFQLGRALPFLADTASYAVSMVAILAVRPAFQQEREPRAATARAELAEGFRFLWGQPFLRTTSFLYGLGNLIIPALLFAVVVIGRREGLSGGAVGALVAAFGGATLAGSLASPLARRRLSIRSILLLELWAGLGSGLFLVWPRAWVLVAAILPYAASLPVTDSVVIGYRVAITPDRLLGRVEGVRSAIVLLIAPLGPLAAGVLLDATSARLAVGAFFALSVLLALAGTLSAALRDVPVPAQSSGSPS